MKKLMIAGVVGLCAAVTFGLESANIVGYQTSMKERGFSAAGSAFASIGNEAVDLQDIKPVAPEGSGAGGWMFYISKMNIGGATSDTYVYMTSDDDGVAKDGWYDADGNEIYIEGVKFLPGEGFYFSTDFPAGESGLTTSGQVMSDSITVNAVRGFSAKCNPYPVEIDLQDITPIAPEGSGAGGWMFYISQMNMGGATAETYVYMTSDDDGVEKDGWYDADGNETYIEGVKFAPTEGFFFSSDFESGSAVKFKGFNL